MTQIEARVTVRLPHDPNGVSPEPGSLVIIDDEVPLMVAYMQAGFLVPTLRSPMPASLKTSDALAFEASSAPMGPDGPLLAPDGVVEEAAPPKRRRRDTT